jgi:hypothetical protein
MQPLQNPCNPSSSHFSLIEYLEDMRSWRKMEYRREECKEDGWSSEESSRRKIEYTREEWGVDGVRQKREEIGAYTGQ